MRRGTVKWFNNIKGYGFLRESDNGEDIFVHYSAIEGDGFKTLKQGEPVTFELEQGPKGLLASRVEREVSAASGPIQQHSAPQGPA